MFLMTTRKGFDISKYSGRNEPLPSERKRVADLLDVDKIVDICERDAQAFHEYAEFQLLERSKYGDRFYYHRDGGNPVLAVAHLDTVQDDRSCKVVETAGGLLAASGALDDRLGAYVILELLPKLGIVCDILLTTDEECAQTTAKEFTTESEYNWVIEFDRAGTDAVMYQYETEGLTELVEASGARVGVGSYSDICELDHLGCAAFNWGVGYADYHSARSHAWLDDTIRSVARFVRFYNANAGLYLPYERPDYSWRDEVTDYEQWWMSADCGCNIDYLSEATYVEIDGDLLCVACYGKGK